MNTQQAENLKLNVTRINSYLIRSNKELKKLRTDRISFIRIQEKKEQSKEKEKRIEAPKSGVGRTLGGVKNFLLAGPKNIFDRILDFLGLIVLGTIVTELPNIIKQIDSILNSSFVKGIGSIFGYMGDRLMSLVRFVGLVDKNKQDQMIKDGEEIGRLSDEIDSDFVALDGILKSKDDELKKNDDQDPTNKSQGPTPQGGDSVTPSQQISPLPKDNPQRLAKGGTVNKNTKSTQEKSTSNLSRLGSKQLQKAREAADSGFFGFKIAADKFGVFNKTETSNFQSFTKMVDNLKTLFPLLEAEEKTQSPTSNQYRGKGAPLSKRNVRGTTTTAFSSVLPSGDPKFTSRFGWRKGRMHYGIDIGVDRGSPVLSIEDGTVDDIIPIFDYGSAIVIKHADGSRNVYGHVDILSGIKEGDAIKKGQKIATVKYWPNANGNKDNTHLHLERYSANGPRVDPSPYLTGITPKKPPVGANGGNGDISKLISNKKGGSGQVIIMAVQPVRSYVPMPTPVPMRSGPPQIINHDNSVSSIWRV